MGSTTYQLVGFPSSTVRSIPWWFPSILCTFTRDPWESIHVFLIPSLDNLEDDWISCAQDRNMCCVRHVATVQVAEAEISWITDVSLNQYHMISTWYPHDMRGIDSPNQILSWFFHAGPVGWFPSVLYWCFCAQNPSKDQGKPLAFLRIFKSS